MAASKSGEPVMLNPALDRQALANAFATEGRLRIAGLLDEGYLHEIQKLCTDSVPYDLIFHLNGQNQVMPPEQLAQLDHQAQRQMQQQLFQLANKGVGFLYQGYRMDPGRVLPAELAPLQSLFEFINSEAMLTFIREISGYHDLSSADGQYTRYVPGHYLTRHSDNITSEGRRLAYVLGMSETWHPDWGGLLQFFEPDGNPADAWLPAFNTLSLFDVSHIYSVTYVTPFASKPRLSLTGWYRR
ncbi:MAG: 2OG-Fe(II) oxygenase [Pseudomonadales bacterium]|nr:2OG-Fe(II) oxygenase [Pseudomonadales bacterium]